MELETTGAPVHTRTLVVSLDQLARGRALASGAIVDVRKRGLVPMASDLQTAGVIHDMRVRAEIDLAPARIAAISVDRRAWRSSRRSRPAANAAAIRARGSQRSSARRSTVKARAVSAPRSAVRSAARTCSRSRSSCSRPRRRPSRWSAQRPRGSAARPTGQRIFHRSLTIDGVLGRDALQLALQQADVHFVPLAPSADTDRSRARGPARDPRAGGDRSRRDGPALAARGERETGRDEFYGAWRDRSAAGRRSTGRSALGGMAAGCSTASARALPTARCSTRCSTSRRR
jgi:hypothetical protein